MVCSLQKYTKIKLPDIDALIKENTSDEFIKKKINDILGNNMIFYRFGEIPEDECSSVWNNNDEVKKRVCLFMKLIKI